MNLHLTLSQTLGLTNLFLTIYVVIDSLEKIYCLKEYRPDGILNWDFLSTNEFYNLRPVYLKRMLNVIFPAGGWLPVLSVRIICSVALLVFFLHPVILTICYVLLFLIGALINLRTIAYGAEAENRFSLIVIGALLLRSFVPTTTVTLVCLWFIALQACLSYVTAGVSKLFNPDWRMGNGFRLVATCPDQVPLGGINIFFEKSKTVAAVINWLIILFECFFPLALVMPREYFCCFLISGFIFHLAIAIWLRLGKFFWVWLATYPALIFITQR